MERRNGDECPQFLLDIKDCVADRLLGVLSVRLLAVTDDVLDEDLFARKDTVLFEAIVKVFGGQTVEELLLEVREMLLFFFGEAVEGPTQENSCGEPGRDRLAPACAFEVGVLAVHILTDIVTVEPACLDSEFAREGKFSVEVRAGTAFRVRSGEFTLVVGTIVEDASECGFGHNFLVLRLNINDEYCLSVQK